MLRWYEFRSKQGTITCKGKTEHQARLEAAERIGASTDELICIGHSPYYQYGTAEVPRCRPQTTERR